MLTPRFELSQTDNEVTFKIYARYANIKETDISVEGTEFYFSSPPFYLRLNLPGEIIENDFASGSYDCDTGTFLLKFPKVVPGKYFENLEMITSLLAPPKNIIPNAGPMIEVIGNPTAENINDDTNDWHFPQTVPSNNNNIELSSDSPKYGFANKISGALKAFEIGWLTDVVDLPSPDTTPMNERKILRINDEKNKFEDEHYLADLFDPVDELELSLSFTPIWYNLNKENINFTNKELDILKELPNKQLILDDNEIQIALFGMIDILFSSCYNHRTTLNDNTAESSFNINKLSATLSWFDTYTNIKDVINTCMRRSLCFQRFRHWTLSMMILNDVKKIIKIGKKLIIKIFCEIYELFNNSFEPRYILNQLYIKDYLIWLQKIPDNMIESIDKLIDNIIPKKEDMDLQIIELEAAAWSCIKEDEEENKNKEKILVIENQIHNMTNDINNIDINTDNNNKNNTNNSSPSESEDSCDSSSDFDTDSSSDSSTSDSSSTDSSSSLSSTESDESDDDDDDDDNNNNVENNNDNDKKVNSQITLMKMKNNNEILDSDDDSDYHDENNENNKLI